MTTFCHKGVAGGSKENLEDELNRDVAVEKKRNAYTSILFLIYAAAFALCLLVPHTIAQLLAA